MSRKFWYHFSTGLREGVLKLGRRDGVLREGMLSVFHPLTEAKGWQLLVRCFVPIPCFSGASVVVSASWRMHRARGCVGLHHGGP